MRTVAIFVDSRANWTRTQTICEAIQSHPSLTLCLVVFSELAKQPPQGVPIAAMLPSDKSVKPSLSLYHMASATGYWLRQVATYLEQKRPDVVIAMTDRFETLAVASASALMNIPVAHVQGGERSGTIDESIRHAVTKLSHLHFVATEEAATVVRSLGEDPRYIFNVGCPATDLLLSHDLSRMPHNEPYVLFLMHPVTTEFGHNHHSWIEAINGLQSGWDGKIVAIGPNHDPDSTALAHDSYGDALDYCLSVTPQDFARFLHYAEVFVTNSSAGIRESCYFGTPTVDIGSRQQARTPRGANVIHSEAVRGSVAAQVRFQLQHGRYPPEYLYGDGKAGKQIAEILATVELPSVQKGLCFADTRNRE